jgi:hypothetical protein
MTKPNNLKINKLLSIITEGEGKSEGEVCRTTVGGRARGGVDQAVENERAEEERGPDGGSQARR